MIVTTPVTGHVVPLLPVARELLGRGTHVSWYTSPRFRDRVSATGAQFAPYERPVDVDWERVNQLYPERARRKGLAGAKWDLRKLLEAAVDECRDLDSILASSPADVVVGDTMAISAEMASERHHLPYAVVGVLPLVLPSRDTPPLGTPFAPSSSTIGQVRNRALNALIFGGVLRSFNRALDDARAAVGLESADCSYFELTARRSGAFLQATVPGFEYERSDLPMSVRFVGALVPTGPATFIEPPWWAELDGGRPVVLVTQGTVTTEPARLIQPTLAALADKDMLVVAAAGVADGASSVLSHPQPNARLETFIPFEQLMPHVDVMVTNGGYGGVTSALVHGVPIVAGGQTEDKAEVCARVAWSGAGINLRSNSPSPARIGEAVDTVLRQSRYRARARQLAEEFAQHDAPREIANAIDQLANAPR